MKTHQKYWLNIKTGEWGIVHCLKRTASLENRKWVPANREKWVEDLVHLLYAKPTHFFVEDPAEFEYIHRCLEKLSITLDYSPLSPSVKTSFPRLRKPLVAAA